MTGLVSILIPAFNAEQWISDAVQSALGQTWPHIEIIIVDDGSRDNTLARARQFESRSVKVVTRENGGASSARNRALREAQGDFIQWLDADDLLAPDKIRFQLEKHGLDPNSKTLMSAEWGRFYFRKKKASFVPHALWQDLTPADWLLIRFSESVWVHPAAWLVSRALTGLAGQWDERLSLDDDGEYFCRVVAASERVSFTPRARSYYRAGNTGSLSWDISDKGANSLFLAASLCINHALALEDSVRMRSACVAFLQHRLGFFYPERQDFIGKLNVLSRNLGGGSLSPRESAMFMLVRKSLGWHSAKQLKTLLWRAEMSMLRNWDRALYELFEDTGSPRKQRK